MRSVGVAVAGLVIATAALSGCGSSQSAGPAAITTPSGTSTALPAPNPTSPNPTSATAATDSATSGPSTMSVSPGTAASASSTPVTGPTRQVVTRPVTSTGSVVAGWRVRTFDTTIDCSSGLRSPVSESPDVLFCSPSAASAIACWHAADPAYAYCLADPRVRSVNRFRLQNSLFPAAHPVEIPPAPAALDLVGGTDCSVRDGGAAARLAVHPDWVPYYFCGSTEDSAVWSTPDAVDGGVRRGGGTDDAWNVEVAATDGSGALHTAEVAVAYFVGTA